MTGVIDFGDLVVGSPALDFWLPVYGFRRLGIEDQTQACLDASGMREEAFQHMQPDLTFLDFRYPILDILHGLDTHDEEFVAQGIEALNRSLPADIVCE